MSWRRKLLWCATLLALALALHQARRALVRSFFLDGTPGAPPVFGADGKGTALPRAVRVRVALIDGLSLAAAEASPELDELCARGLDLRVDNGFPTVSLPVQHVLWTGLTQQQSGVQYRIPRLESPPAGALPPAVPGSVAVAESHPDIVSSFGFARAEPAPGSDEEAWRPLFVEAATRAVGSEAPLAFVHVLRVDEAGHERGAASPTYADAVRWSLSTLTALVAADERAHPGSAWLVLSDHGHTAAGGHGGAEPEIRIVRACLWGPGVEPGALPPGRALHLVDLSRALFDLSGVSAPAGASGRPLAAALADPAPDATLPRPSPLRVGIACLPTVLGLAVILWLRAGPWSLPLWLVAAEISLWSTLGPPSLSLTAIYSPLGRDLALAVMPGVVLLLVQGVLALRNRDPRRVIIALALGPLAVTAALSLLVVGAPPLLPRWSAELSAWLIIDVVGLTTLAALLAALRTRGRQG